MPKVCVANCDNLRMVPKVLLTKQAGQLAPERWIEVKRAVGAAFGWRELTDLDSFARTLGRCSRGREHGTPRGRAPRARLDLGFRRRQFARYYRVLKACSRVGTIAKRLVCRLSAAAETD